MCGSIAFPAALVSPTCLPAAVRGDGGFVARDLLGHRLGRHSGNAQTRLFAGVRLGDHRGRRHARHPAAAVDHHDPLCRRIGTIARPAFPCRHRPGLLLVGLFAIYATFRYAAERRTAVRDFAAHGRTSSLLTEERYTLREQLAYAPRVLPFVLLLTGVMIALYGGYATPSETAGLGCDSRPGPHRNHLLCLEAKRPAADPRRDAA